MSHDNEIFLSAPQILSFDESDREKMLGKVQLIVEGQGTLAFKCPSERNFHIHMVLGNILLSFAVDESQTILSKEIDGTSIVIESYDNVCMDKEKEAFYWFSLDGLSRTIKFGIGEVRDALKQVEKQLEIKGLDETTHFEFSEGVIPIELYRDPVVYDPSLQVKPTDLISIEDIARNNYVVPINLTEACQKLYYNISGQNFELNTSDFPDFVDAIEHSIKNPNGWCYKKLEEKASEFGEPNPEETYLRITLGANQGESPGIPYVIEIWPPRHYSPIHNHGEANAVIRVLHGEINVELYPMLSEYHLTPFKTGVFRKDDITWISPRYNQFHKLHNINTSGPSCITIQCYLYGQRDIQHYKYFDYLNGKGQIKQFTPNSDVDFLIFKELIRKEWGEIKKCD